MPDIISNLELHYPLDGDLLDYSVNDATGAWVGTPAFGAGKVGTNSASFTNGSPANRVESPALFMGEVATWSFWMKPTAGTGTQWVNDANFHTALSSRGFVPGAFVLSFYGWSAALFMGRYGHDDIVLGDYALWPGGVWTHLAITYDRPNSEIKLFVNGVAIPAATHFGTLDIIAATGYCIGGWDVAARHFNGLVDDLHVYTRVLSLNDIQTLAGVPLTNYRGSVCVILNP